jgi:hypothetical protein
MYVQKSPGLDGVTSAQDNAARADTEITTRVPSTFSDDAARADTEVSTRPNLFFPLSLLAALYLIAR